ncbi:transposase-like protein [Azospirillum soli]|nr:transposase-like protein [Azospirillum soli]
MTTRPDPLHAGNRFPAEVISYAVCLSFRFPPSLRMVEEMLALRGITVSHGTVRQRKRFTSPRQVQCFLSIHDPINNLVHLRRDHRPASEHRTARARAFAWAEVAGAPLAA